MESKSVDKLPICSAGASWRVSRCPGGRPQDEAGLAGCRCYAAWLAGGEFKLPDVFASAHVHSAPGWGKEHRVRLVGRVRWYDAESGEFWDVVGDAVGGVIPRTASELGVWVGRACVEFIERAARELASDGGGWTRRRNEKAVAAAAAAATEPG